MRRRILQGLFGILALFVFIPATLSVAQTVPQENPTVDPRRVCSNLGQYVFVGGTGGFEALSDSSKLKDLLQTGHVGLYQHATAVATAEGTPDVIRDIESAFAGTGSGRRGL